MKPGKNPVIKEMEDSQDLDSLIKSLRYAADPELREEAALTIARLSNYDAIESLIRSITEDPDSAVQSTSKQALNDMLGKEDQQAISAYLANPVSDDPWLNEDAAPFFEEVFSPSTLKANIHWDERDIRGLAAVLSGERDLNLKFQAIEALKATPGIQAVDTLAYTALYANEEEIQQAARRALDEMYGKDEAGALLETYRTSGIIPYGDEDEVDEEVIADEAGDDEEDEYEEETDPFSFQNIPNSSPSLYDPQNPVLQEEKTRFIAYLIVALIILFVLGAGYYLLSR
jgi:hypothetical protein